MPNRKTDDGPNNGSVYASLGQLIRLQHQASGFSFLPRQPIHSLLSGRHASRLRGRGLNFEELRSYLPGDDIRNIDWKVTARTREPHVRVYTEERDRAVWLVVDQRRSMFFGSRSKMKSVAAAEAAALSAWRVLGAGDRVGAVLFDDEAVEVITPHRSRANVHHVLARLCAMNRALDNQPVSAQSAGQLNQALARLRPLAPHDCLVVIISDGFGLDNQSREHITSLTEHNDLLSIFVYDPMEQQLNEHGRLVFSDGSRQLNVDTTSARFRQHYQEAFEQRLQQITSSSRSLAIPVLPIQTAEPVLDQVMQQIGRRPTAARN